MSKIRDGIKHVELFRDILLCSFFNIYFEFINMHTYELIISMTVKKILIVEEREEILVCCRFAILSLIE